MGRGTPFIGSEALAAGRLTRHELRTRYSAVLPNIYVRRGAQIALADRIAAVWLWAHRDGVIAGRAAAYLYGTQWIDPGIDVELIWHNARAPKGIVVHQDLIYDNETRVVAGLRVTTPARTAFDLGRREGLTTAVARLDALSRATGLTSEAVFDVAARHHKARGLRQLDTALGLMDPAAQSPKETWLRVLLVRSGYPVPATQIPVYAGGSFPRYYLDMGWEDIKLAIEYDGDQHRIDRRQFVKDVERLEYLGRIGWRVIRVLAEHTAEDVLYRVEQAWREATRRAAS